MARLLLEDGPDAEIEAIFGEMLGDEAIRGHHAQSVDEMMRHAAQRLAAQAKAEQQAREARQARAQAQSQATGKASRADAVQQRKEDAALQAGPMPGWCTTARCCVSSWQRCSRRWPPMRSLTR